MQRKLFLVPVAGILSGGLALAQFGGVFTDPVQSGHAAIQINKAIQQYEATMSHLRTAILTYQLAYANIRAFGSKQAWKGYAMSIYYPLAPDFYGEMHGWNQTNYGFNPLAVWQGVSVAVHPAQRTAAPTNGVATPTSANLATVDIADGTSVAAMQTIADARRTQAANAATLNRYETTVMDTTAQTNSEIEQLNLATTGIALQNRQTANQNALLTTIAEQQMVANKVHRDRLAADINSKSQQDAYAATEPVAWGNTAKTISSW